MKYSVITLLLIIFSCSLTIAQKINGVPVESKDRYQLKIWGTDSLDRGLFILPNKNQFLLVGMTFKNNNGQLVLTTVDKNLNIANEKTYSTNDYDFCFAGAKGHKDGYILSGFTTRNSAGLQDAWVVKITDKGDTLWTTRFGGPKRDQVYETLATRDGHYLVIGQTESWGNGSIDALILKIDESGKILWHKTYGGEKLDRTYSAIELDNGDVIISGITNENYPGNSDILLLRLTPSGDVVWRKSLGSPKGEIAHSLHKRKDNTFFTVGYTAEKSDSLSDPMIMHFNENGEVIGKHIVVTGEDVKLINGYTNSDGNFVGTGFSRKTLKHAWDIVLMKFDFNTSKMTLKKIEISNDEECGYHIQAIDKKTAIVFGHTFSGKKDNLLIKWKHE